jgi:hypothetical protein
MQRAQGYIQIVSESGVVERDTITCGHCQQIVFVKPGTGATVYLLPQSQGPDEEEPGAFCRVCMTAICLPCHDVGRCAPFERELERSESRARFLRSAGLG